MRLQYSTGTPDNPVSPLVIYRIAALLVALGKLPAPTPSTHLPGCCSRYLRPGFGDLLQLPHPCIICRAAA